MSHLNRRSIVIKSIATTLIAVFFGVSGYGLASGFFVPLFKSKKSNDSRVVLPNFVKVNINNQNSQTLMVATHELSVGQYYACVAEGVCVDVLSDSIYNSSHDVSNDLNKQYESPLYKDYPMVGLSWQDTQQYLQWLNDKTGMNFRVPTQQEWLSLAKEHAPKQRKPLFDDPRLAWAADYDITAKPQSSVTEVIGSFGENSLGLHDIKGNVWEWTDDCHLPQPNISKEEYGCVGGRIVMGQRKAGMNETIREPGNGSCYGDQPPANVGLRLVYDAEITNL